MDSKTLAARLRALPPSDIRVAVSVAALLALAQAAWAVWEVRETVEFIREAVANGACTYGVTFPFRSLRTALALGFAAAGLWKRTARGFYISAASLAWVCGEFAFWKLSSRSILSSLEMDEFPDYVPHAWGLYGASGWNVLALLTAVVLLAWEAKTLASAALAARHRDL